MLRLCTICHQLRNTPYKETCRSCYQKQWTKTIPEKQCNVCNEVFKTSGVSCWNCLEKLRKEKSRITPCSHCHRIGLLILNKTYQLCGTCSRKEKEKDPQKKEIRRRLIRESARRQRGTDLNAPIRRSKGWWKTSQGYILIFKPKHPNADVNGCVFQHIYVMSEYLKRPIKKGESIHHINGQRDDNNIENLEIWNRSHPPGQRLNEKIQWAKAFLEEYGFVVNLKI